MKKFYRAIDIIVLAICFILYFLILMGMARSNSSADNCRVLNRSQISTTQGGYFVKVVIGNPPYVPWTHFVKTENVQVSTDNNYHICLSLNGLVVYDFLVPKGF